MIDEKLVDKVLSKTATPEEAKQVAAWFATDEGQEHLSRRYDRESYLLNEQLVSEWIDGEIPGSELKTRFLSRLKINIRMLRLRVAAAVIIPFVLFAGAFTFVAHRTGVFSGSSMAEVTVPYGEQMQVILQDGTIVQLNSGSRLQYPKSFGLFRREVKLNGEGYFSVAKETARPFIVHLNEIDVRVTGTKFDAKAYSDDSKITVSLEEGKVNLIDKEDNVYPMMVGQNADYDKKSGICTVSNADDMSVHTAWRTKSLNFYRTPLRDIIKTLERQYEVQFVVADSSLLNYKFSISTSRVNINDILKDLEKVSDIRFSPLNNSKFSIYMSN